ncbi:MAG TPA: flagellar regulator YcgR PilZN domain-containing protein [Burkholderiales bacterium]|nr:flagellar regulator YcgR PilZN domain-containing protein [Burkholderiales bacterium]
MPDIASRLETTGQLLVRSGIEIGRILNSMVDEQAPVTANLKTDVMFLSRLVSTDPVEQQVTLAYSDHKPANSAVLAAPSITLRCNHRGAQFAFACTKPRQGTHSGRPAIRMTAPALMLAVEPRRPLTRPQIPKEADVDCELRMGLLAFDAKLVDVGLDGAAFMLCDPGIPVCAGTRLERARIRHGGPEPLVVDIDVSDVNHAILPNGKRATRIGCRVAADRAQLEKLIKLFIIDLQ